jgi:hypothetical protein
MNYGRKNGENSIQNRKKGSCSSRPLTTNAVLQIWKPGNPLGKQLSDGNFDIGPILSTIQLLYDRKGRLLFLVSFCLAWWRVQKLYTDFKDNKLSFGLESGWTVEPKKVV